MGNLGILGIGVLLIVAVLFIGYKMDTASSRTQAKRAEKAVKEKKSKTSKHEVAEEYKEDYQEELTDEEEADIYASANMYDTPYEADNDETYETEYVEQNELAEENEYEEEDISLFSDQGVVESTFNSDIDDEIAFETEEVPETPAYEEVVEEEPEVTPEVVEVEPIIEEPAPKTKKSRGRPKKSKKEEVVEEDPEVVPEVTPTEDFSSSTMIFDTEKLNSELDEIDKMESNYGFKRTTHTDEDLEYSSPVDIDAKINELDDEPTMFSPDDMIEGPLKATGDDATNFMNEINRMKEESDAEGFSGFDVDDKDEELKEAHKKYTKKKTAEEIDKMEENKFLFTPEEKPESDFGADMGFLAEMEKNLKQNQKERMTKLTKKKKDE